MRGHKAENHWGYSLKYILLSSASYVSQSYVSQMIGAKGMLTRIGGIMARHFMDGGEPRKLYHYTSIESLEKILSSKYLRATYIKHLSDPSEQEYPKKIILSLINKKIQQGEEVVLWKRVSEFFRVSIELGGNEIVKENRFFVASLCESDNNDYMWQTYAGQHQGCCIEFDDEVFDEMAFARSRHSLRVMYDEKLFKAFLHELIGCVDDFKGTISIQERAKELNDWFLMVVLGLKKAHFQKEQEVRICVGLIKGAKDEDMRLEANVITEGGKDYAKIPFSDGSISQIYIGKDCDFEATRHKIKGLLKKYEFDCKRIEILPSGAGIVMAAKDQTIPVCLEEGETQR